MIDNALFQGQEAAEKVPSTDIIGSAIRAQTLRDEGRVARGCASRLRGAHGFVPNAFEAVAETGMKGRKQIYAQYEPPETLLIERWIDKVLDFLLRRRRFYSSECRALRGESCGSHY